MKKEDKYFCSFCGKSQDDVALIMAGPENHDICDECIDLCAEIVYSKGNSLPFVDQKLGRTSQNITQALGLRPRFSKVNIALVEGQCFYLCPFSEPFNTVYRDHVVPIVERAAMTAKRADDIYGTQPIVEDIWEGICESEIIVADVTGRNPNVMYEIGIAHTIGKPVIVLTQTMDDVPFDLKHYRCVVYSYTPKGMKEFEERLAGTLGFIRHGSKSSGPSRPLGSKREKPVGKAEPGDAV